MRDAECSIESPPQANASLETLPAEIRRQVLFSLDFAGLRALYLQDRRSLLCSCLQKTLGSVMIEACAVHRADVFCYPNRGGPERPEAVRRFHDTYRARSSNWSARVLICSKTVTKEEAASMAAFHSSVIIPLSRRFASCALKDLARQTMAEYDAPLSRTEEMRIIRALYRFQLCCCLFGRPWEIEEVACIYYWVKAEYDQVFHYTDVILVGTVACGLELLHTVLFKSKTHDDLSAPGQRLRGAAGISPAPEPLRRDFDPLPFRGDEAVDGEDGSPPWAWAYIWKDTYSSLYGEFIPDNFRRWGYVVWDYDRLARMAAMEVLGQKWREQHGENWTPEGTREVQASQKPGLRGAKNQWVLHLPRQIWLPA
ncbi:hypothetical protein C8A03DRAFT_41485 [Achaetomium macrosporum]|uniref:Uncharacterized protein n=1 Tax=Achaetomium macrosporum TaxID=79813 RepID=A0AAN7CHC6_9PEZI|nr:hypothetical protein C8A03DRAFT_41485 [Achaetomium macrosporum]